MARQTKVSRAKTETQPASEDTQLGVRLRDLRISAGLTQSQLADNRFSKEYISQIERGKTRPTAETVEWLAQRLGVDVGFLRHGLSADRRGQLEATLARGETLVAAGRHEEGREVFAGVRAAVAATRIPELEFRAAVGEARACAEAGDLRKAVEFLTRAREISEDARFSDVERAEVLLGLGSCRYRLSSTSTAIGLLNAALELVERSEIPSDQLRSRILHWRSRCYRRQRDYEAAREDVDRALQLAESVGNPRTVGALYYQASLLADREGHWVLARSYAERAKAQYELVEDRLNVGRLQNTLGALSFLLGNPEEAIEYLKQAVATALDAGNDADAAQAICSLAQVNLKIGEIGAAEDQARQALKILDGREDYLVEIGTAQLVIGQCLMEQGRLDEAEDAMHGGQASFDALGSAGHRASAWIARGDLASRRGDDREAARLYRQAAEALQDVRF